MGNSLISFWVNRSFFAKKWANKWFSQKNERFAHSHIFGEGPERIAHSLSVLVSNEKWWEWEIRSLFKKTYKKMYKRYNFIQIFLGELLVFCERKSKWAKKTLIRSFISSDLSKLLTVNLFVMRDLIDSLTVPLLSWATWAISSQSLICTERFERLAHSHSLKRAILSVWAMRKWANERMSKFLTLKKGYFLHCKNYYKFWFV